MMRVAARWVVACSAGLVGCVGQITDDDASFRAAAAPAGAPSGDAPVPSGAGTVVAADGGPPSAQARGVEAQPDAGREPAEQASTQPAAPRVYCDAPTLVLTASCGNGSCHSNAGVAIGDFAIGPQSIPPFVDRVSTRGPQCGLIINSHDPYASLILTKVLGTYPDGCGGAMPVGSFGDLTEQQISCLANWVQQFQR